MKHKNQNGFVSIVVSMIIMVILSLVTIGFAQIMSREQRQALDRQLSTQAFYAAESGVNDARLSPESYGTTCNGGTDLDGPKTIRVTCVSMNKTPKSIKKDDVYDEPYVFPLKLTNDSGAYEAPLSITVRWSKTTTVHGAEDFRPDSSTTWQSQSDWTHNMGVVKVYVIPFKNGDTRSALISRQAMALLNPASPGTGSGAVVLTNMQGDSQGAIVNGSCVVATSDCSVTIDSSSLALGGNYDELYLVLTSLYSPSNFEVTSLGTGGTLAFNDVQAIVDSTGRTTDVLRRIQVRVPLVSSFRASQAGLSTFGSDSDGGICKLWTASPDSSTQAVCP